MQDRSDADAGAGQTLLDQELVPLAVAATITYHHVADAASQVRETAGLRDIVHIAAMALSTVATIYRIADQPEVLSEREIRELLFRPREESQHLDLDAYAVRRGDLRAALVALKEARSAFARP